MIAIVGLTRTQRQLCATWHGLASIGFICTCCAIPSSPPSRLWQVTHTKNITNTPWNPFVLLFSYMAYIVSAEHFAAFRIIFYVIWGFLFNLIPRLSARPPVPALWHCQRFICHIRASTFCSQCLLCLFSSSISFLFRSVASTAH